MPGGTQILMEEINRNVCVCDANVSFDAIVYK